MNINKYKFSNAILNLIVGSVFLFLVLFLFFNVKAQAANPNAQTVKPGYFPATITNDGNRTWVAITSPVEGWISDGNFAGEGNLSFCSR